jgi:hypothetical protein
MMGVRSSASHCRIKFDPIKPAPPVRRIGFTSALLIRRSRWHQRPDRIVALQQHQFASFVPQNFDPKDHDPSSPVHKVLLPVERLYIPAECCEKQSACFFDSLPRGTIYPTPTFTVEAIEECTRSLRPVPHRVVRRGCDVEGWIFTCLFHRFVAIPPAQLHTFLHNDDRRSIAPRSAQHPHNENLKGSGGASTAPNGGLRESSAETGPKKHAAFTKIRWAALAHAYVY